MLNYLVKGLRRLFWNKIRASLTIIGIAVGVTSVVVVSSIGDMGKSAINEELSGMGMDNLVISFQENGKSALDQADLETIKSVSSIDNAIPLMNIVTESVIRDNSSPAMVWGVNEDADDVIKFDVLHGRLINRGDLAVKRKVCVIDRGVAVAGYGRSNIIGKNVKIIIGGESVDFEVAGVVNNGVNTLQNMMGAFIPDFIYIPYTVMQDYISDDNFGVITARLSSGSESDEAVEAVKRALTVEKQSGSVSVDNLLKQKDSLNNVMGIAGLALSAVAGISLLVSGISVMTVMLVSVNERTREIGIKKSIGASNRIILLEFLLESVFMTCSGALLGFIAGIGISAAICYAVGLDITVNLGICAAVFAASLTIGILSGVYPAYKAASLKPVDALRHE